MLKKSKETNRVQNQETLKTLEMHDIETYKSASVRSQYYSNMVGDLKKACSPTQVSGTAGGDA